MLANKIHFITHMADAFLFKCGNSIVFGSLFDVPFCVEVSCLVLV